MSYLRDIDICLLVEENTKCRVEEPRRSHLHLSLSLSFFFIVRIDGRMYKTLLFPVFIFVYENKYDH